MKRILLIVCFAGVCLGQQGSARGWWDVQSTDMTSEGHIYHLRGHAEMRGDNMVLRADTIDYDEEKAAIRLMGHVTIETKDKGTLRGDSAEYHANSGELTLTVKIGPKP